jgi:hypothetical protein
MPEHSPLPMLKCAQTESGDWWLYGKGEDGVTHAFATAPDEGTARALVSAVNQAPLLGELEEALRSLSPVWHRVRHKGDYASCNLRLCRGRRDLLLRVRQAREGAP